jgi:histidinol-phosphate phosphatase family protein
MNEIKQAVILCGGKGTRLRPHTDNTPKPMVHVGSYPFLEYLINQLSMQGIEKILILSGYLGEKIRDYFGNGEKWNINIEYSHGPTEWKTAKRLWKAKDLIDHQFLFLYSDNFINFNLQKLSEFHYSNQKPLTISLSKKDNGNIRLSSQNIIEKYDKNRTDKNLELVDIGFMIVNKSITLDFYDHKNSSFSNIIEKMTNKKLISGFQYFDSYYSISDPARLKIASKYLLNSKILLLDRDGTLNYRAPKAKYINSWSDFKWLPGVKEGLNILAREGFKFIVISNQAGVARGMLTERQVIAINEKMKQELENNSIEIINSYFCPHHWDENCYCRKPNPGLFYQASKDFLFRLDKTLFIGDDSRDCQAAYNAGCKSLFIGDQEELNQITKKEYPIKSFQKLYDAVPNILKFYETNKLI